jgi:hypothetical protein
MGPWSELREGPWSELRDLASLLAEVIRRMGAAYGHSDEWRADFTKAVQIMERANIRALEG